MNAPPVVVLRRALTPAQCRVLALIAEAPSYAKMGRALHVTKRTVRMHVLAIADILPVDFVPDGQPKERVILYAVRVFALTEVLTTRVTDPGKAA